MLMYGSSFRMLTGTPRALRIRPILAAVMPLPRELVTPPVTKTYFGIGLPRTSWWLERAAEGFWCGRARVVSPLVYSGTDHTAPGDRSSPTTAYSAGPSAEPVTSIATPSWSCWSSVQMISRSPSAHVSADGVTDVMYQ